MSLSNVLILSGNTTETIVHWVMQNFIAPSCLIFQKLITLCNSDNHSTKDPTILKILPALELLVLTMVTMQLHAEESHKQMYDYNHLVKDNEIHVSQLNVQFHFHRLEYGYLSQH